MARLAGSMIDPLARGRAVALCDISSPEDNTADWASIAMGLSTARLAAPTEPVEHANLQRWEQSPAIVIAQFLNHLET